MIEYKVTVFEDRIEWRNLQNQFHREDGPAIEYVNGDKSWYLNGTRYSEKRYWEKVKSTQSSCDGKIVEIEGKKYKLQLQEV